MAGQERRRGLRLPAAAPAAEMAGKERRRDLRLPAAAPAAAMAGQERTTIDLEEGWVFCITKMKDILEGKPPEFSSSEEIIFRMMCTEGPTQQHSQHQVYDKYRDSFQEFFTSVLLPSIISNSDEFMLRELVRRWSNHKVMVRSRFYNYLDRHFVSRRSLTSLKEVGLSCFRELIYQEIKGQVKDAVIALIDKEREGEQIDRALLKNVLDIFVEIGLGQMDCYENDFEVFLLEDTTEYYSVKAQSWILEDSCSDYMIKAEECLKREKERVGHYLHISSEQKLLEKVQNELLAQYATPLLEDEHSGCSALLRDDKVEDLSRIYTLFSQITYGLEPIANMFKAHVTNEGTALVKHAENSAINKQFFVWKIIELHDKYVAYVTDCFQGHTLFHKALKEAFEVFCNKGVSGSLSAELLATFCNHILKKSCSEKLSDEAIDIIDKVLRLVEYIGDKDLFTKFYRLLFDKSANDEHERSILTKLKQQCGDQFTSKLEKLQNELLPKYATLLLEKEHSGCSALLCDEKVGKPLMIADNTSSNPPMKTTRKRIGFPDSERENTKEECLSIKKRKKKLENHDYKDEYKKIDLKLKEVYLLRARIRETREKIAEAEKNFVEKRFEKGPEQFEIKKLEMQRDELLKKIETKTMLLNELANTQTALKLAIQKNRKEAETAYRLRKNALNELQDLKGAVRIFLRICPLLNENDELGKSFEPIEDDSVILYNPLGRTISFDKVFRADANQDDVFKEIGQLTQSALDGAKVCVFTYGQSGSGKTYTLIGETKPGDEKAGILPRTVDLLYDAVQVSKMKIKVSAFEIYNDKIYDLFSDQNARKLSIAVGEVKALELIPIESVKDAYLWVKKAVRGRLTASTVLNKNSSRSHLIIELGIYNENEQVTGKITFIDLAGSEQLDSKAQSERQEETKAINLSLLELRKFLNLIARKEKFISYRTCSLVHALQASLSNQSKTIMIVNLSQKKDCSKESTRSIVFAESVKSCDLHATLSPKPQQIIFCPRAHM